ncbi:MAG: hypothetical protein HY814_14185 [Candidatus Riflebacteria bacterium]|nr:hypothetical protein [Candidatus Riflebacteria bacterium]
MSSVRGLEPRASSLKPALGFTMIEMVVGVLLATITFGIVWGLFSYDNRRITSSMERLTALRGGEGIVEALRTDIKNLAPPEPDELSAWGAPMLLESSGADGSTATGGDKLTLYRFVRNAGPSSPKQKIAYRFDRATNRVLRSLDGKEGAIGGSKVEDFLLTYMPSATGDYLVYEIEIGFQGMTPMWKPGANAQRMLFRGQIDVIDKARAAERYRYVPSGR